jgi:hypothetical protein
MAFRETHSLHSPWAEFLTELDQVLAESVELHCVGAFVASVLYGLPRPTADIDYVSLLPFDRLTELQALAGPGTPLAQKHRVYLQHVTVATMPENYEERLVEIFFGSFRKLRILGVDPYDLILSKLERNSIRDREDVEYLVKTLHLKASVLRERYERELRPYLATSGREDLTLKIWLSFFEEAP